MEVNGKPFLKNGVRNLMTWKLVAEELAMLASFIEILASRPKKIYFGPLLQWEL